MIQAVYSRIWAFCVLIYKLKHHYCLVLEYWRVVYGPKENWELRLNESAIVSCYRYSEWDVREEKTKYWFAWQFVEPFQLRKVELLYRGKPIRMKIYNHRFHPGETYRFEWHF